MTRCYEYYCLFVCKDEDCKLKEVDPVTGKEKSRRGIFYIRKYIKFMQNKGVKFDKTLEDKQYFFDMVDKYGSEREVACLGEGISQYFMLYHQARYMVLNKS